MGNKVTYIRAINILNPFHLPRDQRNYKNKAESRIMGMQFFSMNFNGCISFI